jgi:Spy/CpxP family protein refolding chaperone
MITLRRALRAATLLSFLTTAAGAQTASSPPAATDPIARTLFEPELIMKHRRAIDLSDAQRDQITQFIRALQSTVVSLQWEQQEQSTALAAELARPRVDIDRALDKLGKLMATERKIKESHLLLLVRIKNTLRPEQQEALQKLRTNDGAP